MNLNDDFNFSFTFTMKRNDVLSLLYGFKVTNNWLKMHGGIMERKKGRRKRGKK